jgi:hypothetical protein
MSSYQAVNTSVLVGLPKVATSATSAVWALLSCVCATPSIRQVTVAGLTLASNLMSIRCQRPAVTALLASWVVAPTWTSSFWVAVL